MKKINLIFAVAFVLLLGCSEHEALLSFKVNNTTGGPIKVVFRSTSGSLGMDSVIVASTVERTIAVNPEGTGKVKTHKETGEYLHNFSRLDVFKSDTIQSQVDFLKSSRWTYTETDSYHADYVATVADADF